MPAIVEAFLQHEVTTWKELFVSPYIVPVALTALYNVQERAKPTWFSFLFWLLCLIPIFCSITVVSAAAACLIGGKVLPPAVSLAAYPLYVHFHLSTESVNSILEQSNFYGDSYGPFYIFFVAVTSPNGRTPFAFVGNVGLVFLVGFLCLGLAFGIQHGIYSFPWDWGSQDAPGIANFSSALSFIFWLLLLFSVRYFSVPFRELINRNVDDTIEPIVRIVITVVLLAFALSGFLFLQPYQATLWLLFWIIAYPVALSFTRGEPLKGAGLVEIYIAGLKQVPVVGQIFAAYMGNPSSRKSSSPPPENDPGAGPKDEKPGAQK